MTNQRLGTTTVVQVGIVVRDIEAKARAWADLLGLPVPEIEITNTVDLAHTEYRGEPTPARAKLAFFQLGQVELELVEPIDSPSTWKDHLDRHGESPHNISFAIKGMKEKVAYLGTKGISLIQRGDFPGGRYAYADSAAQLGIIVELVEED